MRRREEPSPAKGGKSVVVREGMDPEAEKEGGSGRRISNSGGEKNEIEGEESVRERGAF